MGGSAWSNQPIVAALIIIEGTVGGLFLYSGTPAAGNLVASIAAASGTDAFGNAYVAGIALYDSAGNPRLVQMFSANPNFEMLNASGAEIGNMSTLKDALLWYADTGSAAQGALVASIAGKAGTDIFGNAFPQGLKVFQGEFDGTNYVVNSSGLFFYGGAPASGNLIYSIANAAGTDAQGNAYLQGATSYTNSSGTFLATNLNFGQVNFWSASAAGGPYTQNANIQANSIPGDISLNPNGNVFVNSDLSVIAATTGSGNALHVVNTTIGPGQPSAQVQSAAAGDRALGLMVAGDTANRFLADSNGKVRWGPGTATQDTQLYRAAAGQLAADTILANISGAAETWHTLGTLTGATVNAGQFRLLPTGFVAMEIDLTFAVATAVPITFSVTIPAAYRPLGSVDVRAPMAQTNSSGGIGRIFVGSAGGTSAGQVQFTTLGGGTAIGTYSAHFQYPVI